jgi:dihydropteroate synthase
MRRYTIGKRIYDFSARTYIMGVLNVTPDSFSDGGAFLDPVRAVERGMQLVEEGADLVDVGGESSRPRGNSYGAGAQPISAAEECDRILPVIEQLALQTEVPISVDTCKADVARQALAAGAAVVNDISGFRFDRNMPDTVARGHATAVVMHMRGTPQTMQQDLHYDDLFGEIHQALEASMTLARNAGVEQVIVDPGIGFGKSGRDNVRLIRGLGNFADLGCPILVGPSRKAFLGELLGAPVGERLEGTIASVVAAILHGARIVRVHDVRAVRRAAIVADAVHHAAE